MAVDKILVAYDKSDCAKRALDLAIDVAGNNPDAHVDVTYVVPIPMLDNAQVSDFQEILEHMIEDGKQVLSKAIDELDTDVEVDGFVMTGVSPATEIIRLVEQNDYDVIVIGNRGLNGIKEYMGSVSHKVLHGVQIPVLIAK